MPKLDLALVAALTFEKPDLGRFLGMAIALAALQAGGLMPTVLNAANEIAVEAFLAGQLDFPGIARIVEAACNQFFAERTNSPPDTVAEALGVNDVARERAQALLARAG